MKNAKSQLASVLTLLFIVSSFLGSLSRAEEILSATGADLKHYNCLIKSDTGTCESDTEIEPYDREYNTLLDNDFDTQMEFNAGVSDLQYLKFSWTDSGAKFVDSLLIKFDSVTMAEKGIVKFEVFTEAMWKPCPQHKLYVQHYNLFEVRECGSSGTEFKIICDYCPILIIKELSLWTTAPVSADLAPYVANECKLSALNNPSDSGTTNPIEVMDIASESSYTVEVRNSAWSNTISIPVLTDTVS